MIMDTRFGYKFPAIRGVQAKREYYVSMCPLRLIPRIFYFDEDEVELSPELRAQRILNKGRIPELARYLTSNRDDYVFSAITASIDADVEFEPFGTGDEESRIGVLHIPMDARFIINDGQHRRAGIEAALKESPEIGDETISVVFFIDRGLRRCQQMFADLNRYAIRPSKSLSVLYDYRDDQAQVARLVVHKSDFLKGLVEMERSSLSHRSRKLFTLSALYMATADLLAGLEVEDLNDAADIALEYWEEVSKNIPEWQLVKEGKLLSSEIRSDYIHSHGIVLHALGLAGNALLKGQKTGWKRRLKALKKIDWSRSNTKLWEGRAMIGGRLSKVNQNVILTTNIIKKALKLKLSAEEKKAEDAFMGRNDGKKRPKK